MDANLLFVYDETKVVENGLEMRVTGGSPQSLFLDAESLWCPAAEVIIGPQAPES